MRAGNLAEFELLVNIIPPLALSAKIEAAAEVLVVPYSVGFASPIVTVGSVSIGIRVSVSGTMVYFSAGDFKRTTMQIFRLMINK